MKERRRLIALLVGAAALLFAVALLAHRHAAFDAVRDHSSLRRNPWGTAAWRALIERSGVPTATWDRPLTELGPEVEMLIMLAPLYDLTPGELDALVAWVRAGGRLIVAATAYSSFDGAFAREPDAARDLLRRLELEAHSGPGATATVAPRAEDPVTTDVRAVRVPGSLRLGGREGGGPSITTGQPVTLLGEADAAAAVAVPMGRRPVIVLAEAEMLANATLRHDDNVVLAANLIFAGGTPARVHFDEYHHGVRRAESAPERTVDLGPLRDAALALLAVFMIFAFGRSRRFGAPVCSTGDRRPRTSDYVRAFAAIYARAGAAGAAADMLYRRLRHELVRATGLPATADDERLVAALERRGLRTVGLRELLTRLRGAADRALSGQELVELARAVADYERML